MLVHVERHCLTLRMVFKHDCCNDKLGESRLISDNTDEMKRTNSRTKRLRKRYEGKTYLAHQVT